MNMLKSRVHIIGIGGAGMSGIARILLAQGVEVSGSDAKESRRLQSLIPLGAKVFVGHSAENLAVDGVLPAVVVISTAISDQNPEIVRAHELGIPVVNRASALAEVMQSHSTISVAGTHGKTTTTSMTTVVLQSAGLDPSFVIGSELNESGSNAHLGSGQWMVVEADESDGTFLQLPTSVAIVTNVEADHLNYWKDYQAIEDAFVQFVVEAWQHGGCAVVCGDDKGSAIVAQRAREQGARVVTYGQQAHNDAVITLVSTQSMGQSFTVTRAGETSEVITLRVPGAHNALNATAAFLAASEVGIEITGVTAGLEKFSGTHRRFEFRGEAHGVRVFDDYAHHPTEIDAVLRAARSVVGAGRVVVAFQAHHYYRTAMFSKEFGQALGLADYVVVLEVFAPGETPIPGASGSTMASHVPLSAESVVFEPSWSAVPRLLAQAATSGDIIITLGAGDIGMMAPEILGLLKGGS
jgi:UDP-N-acetylmuramate--alanine ligase